MAVGEDGEILAVAGEMIGEAGARQGVGERIGGEARPALLAVGDDRRPGRLHPPDRVDGGFLLLGLELVLADLAGIIGGVGSLQRCRARQRADRLGRDSGRGSRIVGHGVLPIHGI